MLFQQKHTFRSTYEPLSLTFILLSHTLCMATHRKPVGYPNGSYLFISDQNCFYRFHQATLHSSVATNGCKNAHQCFLKITAQKSFTNAAYNFVGFAFVRNSKDLQGNDVYYSKMYYCILKKSPLICSHLVC